MPELEPAAPSPPSPRGRALWSARAWVVQGLAALLVGAVGVVLLAGRSPGGGGFHADVSLGDYDCSQGRVCKLLPKLVRHGTDGSGRVFHYTTNAAGFRSPELPPEARTEGALRVQVYGSSPVFGLGVDDGDTLPEQLARALAVALPGRQVEVMNLGLPENFLVSQLETYDGIGRAYRPDVVVFVQAEATRLSDMNARVRQIKRSRVLTALLATPFGQNLVNRWQNGASELTHLLFGRGMARVVRGHMERLAADQRERGTEVLVFQLHGALDDVRRAVPEGLRWEGLTSGLAYDAYIASPWVIRGEWHPTAEGHRHFVAMFAPAVASALERVAARSVAPR